MVLFLSHSIQFQLSANLICIIVIYADSTVTSFGNQMKSIVLGSKMSWDMKYYSYFPALMATMKTDIRSVLHKFTDAVVPVSVRFVLRRATESSYQMNKQMKQFPHPASKK